MNFLIHQAALGDWVLTFPILRALPGPTLAASSWSKARLAAQLFPGVTPLDAEQQDFALLHTADGHRHVGDPLRQMLSTVDGLLISFVSTGHDDWAANIRELAPRAKCMFVDPRPPSDWNNHVSNWHFHQLREQGVALTSVQPLRRSIPDGPLIIHPGSGGAAKCWPRERFEVLMNSLENIIPILGEVETETWPQTDITRWQERYGARTIHSLDELLRTLALARAFIGNDSGPTHLAAQMGLPTLALFGPTSPKIWGPVGPHVLTLAPPQPQPMTWLNVEHVLLAGRGSPALL